jgi:hypothetical protein
VVTLIATAMLPEPGRAAVAREFEESAHEEIPTTARESRGQFAGVS